MNYDIKKDPISSSELNVSKTEVNKDKADSRLDNVSKEFGPPDLKVVLEKNKKIVIIGAIVLVVVAFYFIFYNKKENTGPVTIDSPVVMGSIIIGQVTSVDDMAKNISVNAFEAGGEKNYVVSVSVATVVVKAEAAFKKTSESKASFSSLTEGQNVNITYEKDDNDGNTILAKKIEIIEFTSPPTTPDNYPKTPPGQ